MDKVADLAPLEVGVKTTSRVALALGASIWPETLSFWMENMVASVPVILTLLIVRLSVPSLVTVTVRGELDELTGTGPKLMLVGLTVISG